MLPRLRRGSRRWAGACGGVAAWDGEDRYGDFWSDEHHADEAPYVPRRGRLLRLRSLPRVWLGGLCWGWLRSGCGAVGSRSQA